MRLTTAQKQNQNLTLHVEACKPQQSPMKIRLLIFFLTVGLPPLFFACSEEILPANVVGYNHTAKDIGDFTVNGKGGGFLQAHKGGGGFVCCMGVPKNWKKNYQVTVKWTDDHGKSYKERTVEVPKYKKVGDVAVHFLRNGDVKVFVTMLALWHPDYPLKGPEAKLEP